jgi:nucleoside transporter
MNTSIRFKLSLMMFLQFFVWGAWFVTLGTYLSGMSFDGAEIGAAYSTMPWGALIAPFFVGMVADRFFNSERVMGICHLVGAAILFYAASVTDANSLFWVLFAYALAYNPTLALVNSISFSQMDNSSKQFPAIRVWGTIGWIVAGLLVGTMGIENTALPMKIAAGASVVLGVYSFFLPKTPPKSAGQKVTMRDVLNLDALSLMKDRSFAVFAIGSMLICIPLAFYYNFTNLFLNEVGMENAAGKMTLGQMSEIFFMVVMPFFLVRLGIKKMLLFGMLAWAARYLLFALGNSDSLIFMFYSGIILHGICYDFFFVTGHIHVDNVAPKKIQASAQGFIALITYGLGLLIGTKISGMVVKMYETELASGVFVHDWKTIWLIPAVMAAVIIIVFAIFFKEPKAKSVEA